MCRCRSVSLDQYHRKLSGPLLDRFDLITVLGVRTDWKRKILTSDAQNLVERLLKPANQEGRIRGARRQLSEVKAPIQKSESSDDPSLSRRGLSKVAGVARTLAALDGSMKVEPWHRLVAGALRENMERVLSNKCVLQSG